jgi:hypothetical protein
VTLGVILDRTSKRSAHKWRNAACGVRFFLSFFLRFPCCTFVAYLNKFTGHLFHSTGHGILGTFGLFRLLLLAVPLVNKCNIIEPLK